MIYELEFSKNGSLLKKQIKAKSLLEAQNKALAQGINILSIKEKSKTIKLSLSNDDLILFFKELGLLCEVGLSINEALSELKNAFKGRKLSIVVVNLQDNLKLGLSLSKAFSNWGFKLNLSEIALIKTAENTGQIAEIFTHISSLRANLQSNQKRLNKVLQYPIIVLFSLVFAFIFLMLFVVPNFKDLFENMGASLPLITRVLLAIYEFLDVNLQILALCFAGVILSLILAYKKSFKFALICDKITLQIPILSRLILYNQLYYFFMIFSLLLKSGLGLEKSFSLASRGLKNRALLAKFELILKQLQNGQMLDLAFKNTALFDPLISSMLSIALKSAKLGEIAQEIASTYASRQDDMLGKLSLLLEPIITLFVAILVLFLALGIFLPMWELSAVN